MPPVFNSRRANFGLESLTGDGSFTFWTANEEALSVDGPLSTPSAGTVIRLLETDQESGPRRQFAYVTDPMHGSVVSGARSGVSDLLYIGPYGVLLALDGPLAVDEQRSALLRAIGPRGQAARSGCGARRAHKRTIARFLLLAGGALPVVSG